MKYIIMAGGHYDKFKKPKQLLQVNGEVIIERIIRLLRENGISDIAISTNNPAFDYIDVSKLRDEDNQFEYWGKDETKKSNKSWLKAYYLLEEPVCYLHGDVYFSDEAIKTIVKTQVKDTIFFCTYDKWDGPKHIKSSGGREPFAYKVQNYKLFNKAIKELLQMIDDGKFTGFPPCAWTVYRYINGLDLALNAKWYGDFNDIFKTKGDYIVINDYTNDVDDIKDVEKIEKALKRGENMVKVEVIEEFTLGEFSKLKNIKRARQEENGRLFVGDVFECDEQMQDYLLGDNAYKKKFIKVIEVIPEKKERKTEKFEEKFEEKIEISEEKVKPKVTFKKTTKKRK